MTDGLKHPHHGQPVKMAGTPLGQATSAVIMLHGRGATAEDILSLADELHSDGVIFIAPQAAGHTWYPFSFLVPIERNEPFLSSALMVVSELLKMLREAAIPASRTMLLGFSQGACLALEYAARDARRYGGIAGLSGGLIGPEGFPREYNGSFDGTPVFLGCSERDPHIPTSRVIETENVFQRMGANVTRRLYPTLGHAINADEIAAVQKMLTEIAEAKS
jgi:phospholipase/carboxylesterase